MLRRLYHTFLGCLIIITVNGQASPLAKPSMSISAYSNDQPGIFSFLSNEAALAAARRPGIGMYSERRFLLEGVNHFLGVAIFPVNAGSFGFKLNGFGFSEYTETSFGLGYGRKLSPYLDVGAVFSYRGKKFKSYGKTGEMACGMAVIIHPVERLNAGIRLYKTVSNEEMLYSFGVGYDISGIFLISCGIEKENLQKTGFNAGCSYKISQRIVLKTGFTNHSILWMEAGMQLKSFQLNFFSSYHFQLGLTPGLGMQFYFKKEAG